jgi:4-hydroxy-tetrahydrodipicolinate synthase
MTRITGSFVAIVTPFVGNERRDITALRRQVNRQASAGNGVFCAGTNGEFYRKMGSASGCTTEP